MKWVAIAGSWKNTSADVERDVRQVVSELFHDGKGVVTGGALGVDYFATDEMLKLDSTGSHLKIFLPSTLERYAGHYRKRASEGAIAPHQAEDLIGQLNKVKALSADAIVEDSQNIVIDQKAYFDRITQIVNNADELVAFQVNQSVGTQDTIDKAKKKGIPVRLFSYTIQEQ